MATDLHAVLQQLAATRAGCITGQQLHAAGLAPSHIRSLRDRRVLRDVVRGVYLYGADRLSDDALLHAACLRGGRDSQLAERTALRLLELLKHTDDLVTLWLPRRSTTTATTIRLTTRLPVAATGRPATIELRQRRRLRAPGSVRGLPVSHPADALVALAAHGPRRDLYRAWREADFRGMLAAEEVEARLGRGVAGSTLVRELLAEAPILGRAARTLSRAEKRLYGGLVRRGLASFAVNRLVRFGSHELRPDFFDFDAQLAIEVLGGGHDNPGRQLEDLRRLAIMREHGVEIVEIGDEEIWRNLERCVDIVAERLAARLPTPR